MSTSTEHITWDDVKKLVFSLAEQSRETDRRMQETDQILQKLGRETDRQLRELGKQIGGLGDKFGYFTEGLALPSMERILIRRFAMENISPRLRVRRLGQEREYDVLAWSNDRQLAVMVEVKSRVKKDAIEQLLGQLADFPDWFPDKVQMERIGILAGVDWDLEVREEAQQAGLYTADIHDEIFEIRVPEGFMPRHWR